MVISTTRWIHLSANLDRSRKQGTSPNLHPRFAGDSEINFDGCLYNKAGCAMLIGNTVYLSSSLVQPATSYRHRRTTTAPPASELDLAGDRHGRRWRRPLRWLWVGVRPVSRDGAMDAFLSCILFSFSFFFGCFYSFIKLLPSVWHFTQRGSFDWHCSSLTVLSFKTWCDDERDLYVYNFTV